MNASIFHSILYEVLGIKPTSHEHCFNPLRGSEILNLCGEGFSPHRLYSFVSELSDLTRGGYQFHRGFAVFSLLSSLVGCSRSILENLSWKSRVQDTVLRILETPTSHKYSLHGKIALSVFITSLAGVQESSIVLGVSFWKRERPTFFITSIKANIHDEWCNFKC